MVAFSTFRLDGAFQKRLVVAVQLPLRITEQFWWWQTETNVVNCLPGGGKTYSFSEDLSNLIKLPGGGKVVAISNI